jgi:hypothetical protein
MRVIIYLVLVLMTLSLVTAQEETWRTSEEEWEVENINVELVGSFGERPVWWRNLFGNTFAFVEQDSFKVTSSDFEFVKRVDLGNVKNGYFVHYSGFPLLTSAPPGVSSQDYRRVGSHYEFLLGAQCEVGQYMLVRYSNQYSYSSQTVAYTHFWHKTHLGDIIYGADSTYWTSGLSGTIAYGCYNKKSTTPTYTYNCINGVVSENVNGGDTFRTSCSSGTCKTSKLTSSFTLSNTALQSQLCTPSVTCYQCDGINVQTKQASSCSGGWTSTRLTNSDCRVTCYGCDTQGNSITQTFASDVGCTGEWSFSQRSCQQPSTTCYQCSSGEAVSSTFQGSTCPTGWVSNSVVLNCEEELQDCYKCEGGNLLSEKMDTCPLGWSTQSLNCQDVVVQCGYCDGKDAVYNMFSGFEGACPSGWDRVTSEGALSCEGMKLDWVMISVIGGILIILIVSGFIFLGGGKKKR